jgi:hypothetical protein
LASQTRQLWLPDARNRSSTIQRVASILSHSVLIIIPGAAGMAQAGNRGRAPSTSTMHMRHEPVAVVSLRWHRVGMVEIPAARATSKMVCPGWNSTVIPLMLGVGLLRRFLTSISP